MRYSQGDVFKKYPYMSRVTVTRNFKEAIPESEIHKQSKCNRSIRPIQTDYEGE